MILILFLGLCTYCHQENYHKISPRIAVIKNTSSFYSLQNGQTLIVDGTKGNQYHGYFYVEGKKYAGYLSKDEVLLYTFDETFESQIQSFPNSYKQSLRILHFLHPQWSFELFNTSLDFEQTASIFQTKSLIDSDQPGMISQTDVIEGKSWRRVSLEAARYYLDPRHGLDNSHALMFEKLTYNPYETLKQAQNMLLNTKMSGLFWAKLFHKSALLNNISMSLIITRAIQEQSGGGLGLSGGHARGDSQGKTYYNIFNIGANTSDQDGIDFAAQRNWDTIEKSVLYGAQYLAENYIHKGQDTLYLQKFDVQNHNPGHHYYMSNILAPYSEAKNMMKGYLSNQIVEIHRILQIPVYLQMPLQTSYPIPGDIKHSSTLLQNQMHEFYLSQDNIKYKKKKLVLTDHHIVLRKNVDYAIVDHGTYFHVQGLNNYIGSFDIKKSF